MFEPELSAEMVALQSGFEAALTANAGFFYPYRYPGFACNIWAADVRGARYAAAVLAVPELAQTEVRFLTVRPGDSPPPVGTRLPFEGGTLTLRHWGQIDPLSGECIAACSWDTS